MNLLDAFEDLYRPRNLRSASERTITLWHLALRFFDRFHGRLSTLDDLTDDNVSRFAAWRLTSVAPATVNRDLASLLALWRYAHRRGLIDRWPDVQLEREPKRVPIAWTQDEFRVLFSAASKADGSIGIVPAKIWWPAILSVCFDTGERIGAVLDLEWTDVDLARGWIIFPAETRKGRDQDNASRIATDTVARLKSLRGAARSAQCFPWPYTRTYVWRRYGKLLERAGLPNDRKRKFHCIRKTTASHVEAAGGNATEVLRHASRRNTMAYLDPRITKPRQAIEMLWRPDVA